MKNKILKGGIKEMKKTSAGILAFSMMLILGVGLVAAFPMMGGHWEVSEEEMQEQAQFMEQVQQAIADEDFDTWESLMVSQITYENFQKQVEIHQEMEQRRLEMEEQRAVCGANPEDCPMFGEGQGPRNNTQNNGQGQMHKAFNQEVKQNRWAFWKGFGFKGNRA